MCSIPVYVFVTQHVRYLSFADQTLSANAIYHDTIMLIGKAFALLLLFALESTWRRLGLLLGHPKRTVFFLLFLLVFPSSEVLHPNHNFDPVESMLLIIPNPK